MIRINKNEYKTISEELIKSDIKQYKSNLNKWRNSVNIPKPYPAYLIVEKIVENDEEWELVNQTNDAENEPSHDELIDTNNENYNYVYARTSEYGSIEEQIEYITENGLEAWQLKVSDIKNKYPKS